MCLRYLSNELGENHELVWEDLSHEKRRTVLQIVTQTLDLGSEIKMPNLLDPTTCKNGNGSNSDKKPP